jgi:hypothetical protein
MLEPCLLVFEHANAALAVNGSKAPESSQRSPNGFSPRSGRSGLIGSEKTWERGRRSGCHRREMNAAPAVLPIWERERCCVPSLPRARTLP